MLYVTSRVTTNNKIRMGYSEEVAKKKGTSTWCKNHCTENKRL